MESILMKSTLLSWLTLFSLVEIFRQNYGVDVRRSAQTLKCAFNQYKFVGSKDCLAVVRVSEWAI